MFSSFEEAKTQTASHILSDIRARRSDRHRIRKGIDTLAEELRGVTSFSEAVDTYFDIDPSTLFLQFSRQIPTISVENLAVDLLGEWLGEAFPVQTETVGLVRDSWGSNGYKKSLVSLPVIDCVNDNGEVVVSNVKSTPKKKRDVNRRLLHDIDIDVRHGGLDLSFQGKLPAFHQHLRERAGCKGGDKLDISLLYEKLARESTKPPECVYVDNDGFVKRTDAWSQDQQGFLRPGAEWYYLLYLASFCDGNRALVASTIEEDDDNIRQYFLDCMDTIEKFTGVRPLIVWTPHFAKDLVDSRQNQLDFNQVQWNVIRTPEWRSRVRSPEASVTCYDCVQWFARELYLLEEQRTDGESDNHVQSVLLS